MEYSNGFVVLMGVGTVFIGLVCIIILVTIMSKIIQGSEKRAKAKQEARAGSAAAAPAPATVSASASASVTPEMVAAVSAVLAEEMGTDVGAIRILSFKRV